MLRKHFVTLVPALAAILLLVVANASANGPLTLKEQLGKQLFFDTSLSATGTQACADCHVPEAGFTGSDATANAGGAVHAGSIPHRFGNRKPPTAAYSGDSPNLYYDEARDRWFGGMFWDGRATGEVLGDPLAEQAQAPYLNPLEQALPNDRTLCVKVKQSEYAALFEQVWGLGSLDCARKTAEVYTNIAHSVAAYERSTEVTPYSSKFDQFWDNAAAAGKDVTRIKCGTGGGMGGGGMMGCPGGGTDPHRWTMFRGLGLNDSELQGLAVFNTASSANCASCHTLQPGSQGYPLFTDFGYDNLGIPRNPANPFYSLPPHWNPDGEAWVDNGLGGYLSSAGHAPEVSARQLGKVKVPTLRNVDLRPSPDFVKAYGHNGYFKSLEEVIFFYHWRAAMDAGMGGGMGGAMANMFPPPEVDQNRTRLGFFPRAQEANIVNFLKTLSDGYYQR